MAAHQQPVRVLLLESRSLRIVRFAGLLLASWVVMTLTHESGHILGGWLSGAVLVDFDLWPWHLPYSRFAPDPQPLVTLWAGPVLGVLIPVGLAAASRRDWSWFIADFCLLANGSYIAAGWLSEDRFLDTTSLLHQGAHPATIAVYSLLTISFGYIRFRRDCIRLLAGALP